MVASILQKRGYEVDTANDGQEAFEKALANIPDLLITDVMMPKMDGWSLVKALRARPEFNFVPVIFLTALTSDDDRIRGFRLGADDYLPKPFRFEELDLRVSRTVRRRESLERETRAHIAGEKKKEQPSRVASALTGNLSQIGLSILLTLLEMEQKTGILQVSDNKASRQAEIRLRSGRVVAAEMQREDSSIQDEECIYHLLKWNSGRFEFVLTDVDVESRMSASATQLLMEGAKRIDEFAEEQRRQKQADEEAAKTDAATEAADSPAEASAEASAAEATAETADEAVAEASSEAEAAAEATSDGEDAGDAADAAESGDQAATEAATEAQAEATAGADTTGGDSGAEVDVAAFFQASENSGPIPSPSELYDDDVDNFYESFQESSDDG